MRAAMVQVDAFTDRPLAGNPAAVCVLAEAPEEAWMQAVAAEMNLAATVFVLPGADGFPLRWFSPVTELDLCGHGTLAAAHVIWEEDFLPREQAAVFETRAGALTARWEDGWIDLDLPALPAEPAVAPPGLERALGVAPVLVGRSRHDYLAEVASEDELRSLQPDLGLLAALPARGVIVTSAAGSPDFDFVTRYFAPQSGIPEDAVTGSAHATLGPFWQDRLGRDVMVGFQASRRGGVVRVRPGPDRVWVGGRAVTVLRGALEA